MSIRIKDLPPKVGKVTNTTKIPTEDPGDLIPDATRMIGAIDIVPFTWGISDEDSPLTIGLLYTTEAGETRTIQDVILSLKNTPTANTIEVDILKETSINTNAFVTIFSTKPTIMINEFTSQTSTPIPVFSTNTWEAGRRLQIVLTINDANFAATGLKVTLKS